MESRLYDEDFLIFYPDGTWNSNNAEGYWSTKDDKLILIKEEVSYKMNYTLISDNSLKIIQKNGIVKFYIRK